MENNDALRVTLEFRAACGCAFKMAALDAGSTFSATNIGAAVKHLADAVAYWAENRLERHDCALVSATNRHGTRPLEAAHE